MMMKYMALFALAVGALAQEQSLPNPEILKWQAEAQARERTINRRAETQLAKAAVTRRTPGSKPVRAIRAKHRAPK